MSKTRKIEVPSKSVVFVFSEDGVDSIPPEKGAYEDEDLVETYMVLSGGLASKLADPEFQQSLFDAALGFGDEGMSV